jgi:hypothetical protein
MITKFHTEYLITLVIPENRINQATQILADTDAISAISRSDQLTDKNKSKTHQHSPSHDQQQ